MKSIFLTTIAMLTVYYGLIFANIIPTGVPYTPDQTRSQLIANFVYADEKPDFVLIGSSRANLMFSIFWKNPPVALTLPGRSSLSGLTMLERSKKYPRVALIECDPFSFRSAVDEAEMDKAFGKQSFVQAFYNRIVQYKYRPLNILMGTWKPPKGIKEKPIDPIFRAKLLHRMFEHGSVPQLQFRALLPQGKSQIDGLKKNGVRVILFEVPIDPEIRAQHADDLALIKQTFPLDQYEWLDPPEGEWKFADLGHLLMCESQRLTEYVEKQLIERGAISAK